MWARLRNRETNHTMMFVNHHGPLPVGTGGRCGGEATAFNLLKLIAVEAYMGDAWARLGGGSSRTFATGVVKEAAVASARPSVRLSWLMGVNHLAHLAAIWERKNQAASRQATSVAQPSPSPPTT